MTKPILTRAELEFYDKKCWLHDRLTTKHTIELAVELLREWMLARYHGHYPHETEKKTAAFLSRYDGKDGE